MAIAVLALGALVAGCGGDESETTETASEPLSPTAFVAQAKRICADGRVEIQEAITEYQKENGSLNPTDVGSKAVSATLVPVQNGQIERLEALTPPEEIAEDYEGFLESRKDALEEIEQRKLSSNTELFKAFERSDKMARDLQLIECAFG